MNSGRYEFCVFFVKKRFDTGFIFMHYTPVFTRDGLSVLGEFFFERVKF